MENAEKFLNPDYEKHSHDPFLLKNMNIKLDENLVKKKLKKLFNKLVFISKIMEKEKYWSTELGKFVIGHLPSFNEIKKEIEERL